MLDELVLQWTPLGNKTAWRITSPDKKCVLDKPWKSTSEIFERSCFELNFRIIELVHVVLSLDLVESTQADSLKIRFVQLIFRVVLSGYTAYVYVYMCM